MNIIIWCRSYRPTRGKRRAVAQKRSVIVTKVSSAWIKISWIKMEIKNVVDILRDTGANESWQTLLQAANGCVGFMYPFVSNAGTPRLGPQLMGSRVFWRSPKRKQTKLIVQSIASTRCCFVGAENAGPENAGPTRYRRQDQNCSTENAAERKI